jgi:hypothetical protein
MKERFACTLYDDCIVARRSSIVRRNAIEVCERALNGLAIDVSWVHERYSRSAFCELEPNPCHQSMLILGVNARRFGQLGDRLLSMAILFIHGVDSFVHCFWTAPGAFQ